MLCTIPLEALEVGTFVFAGAASGMSVGAGAGDRVGAAVVGPGGRVSPADSVADAVSDGCVASSWHATKRTEATAIVSPYASLRKPMNRC